MKKTCVHGTGRRGRTLPVAGLLLAGLLLAAPQATGAPQKGFVDSSAFVELAGGDDAVLVEINFAGPLLRAFSRVDEDLYELARGLERIHAVILDLGEADSHESALKVVSDTARELRRKGWDRIARVKETDADVQVWVVNDEETIQGLVVMVVSREDNELIFANVAGVIDLGKIQAIGEQMEIPGLEGLQDLE